MLHWRPVSPVTAIVLALGLVRPAAIAGQAGDTLDPYVEFLDAHRRDPVEYVLSLYEAHDLVVVAERAHSEATQYDFIRELVTDPRFREKVSHVYTEVGLRNLQPRLDSLMGAPGLDGTAFRERLIPLYRDITFHPIWDRTNFFDFLTSIYLSNQALPRERRIDIVFADVALDWGATDAEAYGTFRQEILPERDQRMARRIIEHHRRLRRERDPRARGLVIMNYRHAFNDFRFDDGTRGDNVGRYLFQAVPGQVANVLINSVALRMSSTDQEPVLAAVQDGTWDAAFRRAGVSQAGFPLTGSPFGGDQFDLFPFRTRTVTYADVFTGLVFHRHLPEHQLTSGVPGLVDREFLAELSRRFKVVGLEMTPAQLDEFVVDEPTVERYRDLAELEETVRRWLHP